MRNKKKDLTHTKLWDRVKAILREKCIAINAYIEKKEHLWPAILHKIPEKEEQNKPKPVEGRKS